MNIIGCKNEADLSKTAEVEMDNVVEFEYATSASSISHNGAGLIYNISFPQIEKSNDSNKQARINCIVENEVLKVLNYYKSSIGNVELDIDYTITLESSRILSIQYYGNGVVSGAAHPNKLFYTSNIDLLNESMIKLSDVIVLNEDFCRKFVEGEFKALWPEQNENIDLIEFDTDELLVDFENADSLDTIETDNQSDVFSYFTENSLGISIPVPYSIGGHAEYEIEYSKITSNIEKNGMLDETNININY